MSKVFISAVVIIPPQDIWAPIQAIRKIYDRNIHRWMPHITLLYPFRPESEFDAIENDILKKCKLISSFEIVLKEINYFNHGRQRYTLWSKPEPLDLIIELQASILEIVPDCNDVNKYKNGFNPHLSVGQINGKSKLRDALNTIQNNWKNIGFLVGEIFFIAREKNKTSKFEIKKRIQLQKE